MENNLELDWNVRLFERRLPENRYRDYWGDEHLWTSMLPLAWTTLDIEGISIRPRKRALLGGDSYESAIAQWSMAIHLLGLGMGWTDVGKGLREWRNNDLREGYHPILDYLLKNFHDQIEALEVYFGMHERNEILDALAAIRAGESEGTRSENSFGEFSSEYEFQLKEFLEEDRYGERGFARLLLDGGSDPLHLDSHCAASFRDPLREMMGMERRRLQGSILKISTPFYGGWAHRLAATTKQYRTDEFLEADGTLIEITIDRVGFIGTFAWGGVTNRWFRYSENYGDDLRQFEAHCWGN